MVILSIIQFSSINTFVHSFTSTSRPYVGSAKTASLDRQSMALHANFEELTVAANEPKEDDEFEYVEEEFEELRETDLYGSEWKVGTVMEKDQNKIVETWVRLLPSMEAVWGDGSQGKWSLDVRSQFFSISKESWGGWLGKKLWAGVVDDYYFLQGSVRGWSPIQTASVLGQWQMKRLGVSPDEAGVAPWFEQPEEEEEEEAVEAEDTVAAE